MSSNGHVPPTTDRENGHKKMRLDQSESGHYGDGCSKTIRGKVVLMKKKNLDVNSIFSSIFDRFDEFIGHGVSLQLVSSDHGDSETGGNLGTPAYLEDWIKKITPLTDEDIVYNVTFDWNEELGLPGAVIVKNEHHAEFYLKTITLENVPAHGIVHFFCNSWVYPASNYHYDRVFFTNKPCLPFDTPITLRKYREDELVILRGNGEGVLHPWDRVYDYAYYNDLGNPDKGEKYVRKVLGGSSAYPYPRRGRTNRPPTKTDPKTESRLPAYKTLQIYVPRDERFGPLKMSDAVAYGIKSLYQFLYPEAKGLFDGTFNEFESFEQVLNVYEGGLKLNSHFIKGIKDNIPVETIKELVRSDGEHLFKFPMPDIVKESKSGWRTDEEFAREMLAGINPVVIRRLQEFPPTSKLDPKVYGNQTSSISRDDIEINLDGLSIEKAIKNNKLFILDHHDDIMPFIDRINSTSYKGYATRTILFLKDDGTLKPVAIELSLPNLEGDKYLGAVSTVYTPSDSGVKGSIWEFAKAYVAVNDSSHHQLISHWLKTHATIEPFIIAANRQLSVMHPIYKLLHPHFRDTMNVNALAREILINAGGALQYTLFPEKYSMDYSSSAYKSWVFPDQALPADLIKRGMAIEDSKSPHGIRLMIKDYPYAVDGLEIWSAIKVWVADYCTFYYHTDKMVKRDLELQSWWHELRTVGHGDKKNEPWWPKMHNIKDLIETCTTIIWLASAYHAAINFGQYPFGGYLPNRPSISRRHMPEEGTNEYRELEKQPEKEYLKTITPKLQTLLGISLIEVLSRHTADEVYLGEREAGWTCDLQSLHAFQRFGEKLKEIEGKIIGMNKDEKLKNRNGPVNMSYTLLIPSSEVGLTGRGIPNSVSI